jgi:hypothetical protein
MAYRNRRFPFTGSMGADVMIGTVAAYALVAVVLTHFGRPLARYAPGILTYFSFQDEMGWNYTFYEGNVGPFQIGQDENETRDALRKCGCFKIIDERASDGSLLASRFEAGSFVSYLLFFSDKKLSKVNAFSYFVRDL